MADFGRAVTLPQLVAEMEARVADIAAHQASELVWLLEHPPLYTSGTSGKAGDLLTARFPMFQTGRGGQHTYHGPGQRVAYVMLDLKRRQPESAPTLPDWRNGSSGRWLPSMSAASAAKTASGSGSSVPTKAKAMRTRSPRSASACGAGSRSTELRSMWSRICRTSRRSCPAVSPIPATASPRWWTSVFP